jgi:hypothetical protein
VGVPWHRADSRTHEKTFRLSPGLRQARLRVEEEHFWQKRYYDFNVWSARKRQEKLHYMHQNPVRRGLVEAAEMWAWSSCRAYAGGESGPVKLNEWPEIKIAVAEKK